MTQILSLVYSFKRKDPKLGKSALIFSVKSCSVSMMNIDHLSIYSSCFHAFYDGSCHLAEHFNAGLFVLLFFLTLTFVQMTLTGARESEY